MQGDEELADRLADVTMWQAAEWLELMRLSRCGQRSGVEAS